MKNNLLIILIYVFLASCGDSILESSYEPGTTFKVSKSCGEVVFREKLSVNFSKALEELERRKTEEYSKSCPESPCAEIYLEVYKLEVEDADGNHPKEDFFAVRVLEKESGVLLESVNDVITTSGNLFWRSWCPD